MPMDDRTDDLVNKKGMGLYFYHLPTGKEVVFKAFLTSYEDSFNSKWSSERVYGRNDPIHTFQGTERSISLAWDVPARDYTEAKENFIKASTMYTMLYPTYKAAAGQDKTGIISGAPLIKIKFGNLIIDASKTFSANATSEKTAKTSGLLGYIDGLKFSPDLESGFFDGGESVANPSPGELIPQTIKLSCNFHILHSHALGWSTEDKKLRKAGQNGNENYPFHLNVKSVLPNVVGDKKTIDPPEVPAEDMSKLPPEMSMADEADALE